MTLKSQIKVTRMKEMINNFKKTWLLNKFSLSAPKELMENIRENMHTDVRV